MVIVKLKGGLGNQMFQYAFGRRIASENNLTLKLDISDFDRDVEYKRSYSLKCFNIIENIADKKDLRKAEVFLCENHFGKCLRVVSRLIPYHKRYILREKRVFVFDPRVLGRHRDIYIDGYWQNGKYFSNIDHIVRKEFTFKHGVSDANRDAAQQIQNTHSIGIHVRNYGVNQCGKDLKDINEYCIMNGHYYQEAVNYVKKILGDIYIYVFSDDIEYAKQIIQIDCPIRFMCSSRNRDFEELQLLCSCKHQITANSTFSWWAGWLNDNPSKIVVAPERWFSSSRFDTSDLIPKDWIKM
jgi:hypothetical protein